MAFRSLLVSRVKYRTRTDIMAVILESTSCGIAKTKLVIRANRTSGQLKDYLDVLVTKNLVVHLADNHRGTWLIEPLRNDKVFVNLFSPKRYCSLLVR
jgi:predicted transcriptional regulator